ncbi:Peptidase MprA-like catalytic domain [Comamonadaceae bacterium]
MRVKRIQLPPLRLVLALMGAVAPWAHGETKLPLDLGARPRSGAVSPEVSAAQPAEKLQRLLVKFKDASAAREPGAAGAARLVTRMSRSAYLATAGQVQGLGYLRTTAGEHHVMLTDRPLDRGSMQSLVKALAQDSTVESVSIDERMAAHAFSPNDTAFLDSANPQWYLKAPTTDLGAANFANAWNRTLSGSTPVSGDGVVVAVLDSGYRPHTDLDANLLTAYDFISTDPNNQFGGNTVLTANDGNGRDSDAQDPGDGNSNAAYCETGPSSWHGTRVAGIISAVTNNSSGMAGAAYGARVIPLRVLGVCGGYVSDIVDAMRWAAGLSVSGVANNANPAKVINLSLGGSGSCNSLYQAAINEARTQKKATVVVSTGNDGYENSITQPANCQNVIAVTAHRPDGNSPRFANVGAGTTLSAPGTAIYSTSNAGSYGPATGAGADIYQSANGTSFAAPLVASVAALLYQIKPLITPDEVASRLVNSVRAFPTGLYCSGRTTCGAGLLDADAAVAMVQSDDSPFSIATASPYTSVARGATVTLQGSAGVGANSTALSTVQWSQVSGPQVVLSNPSGYTATFVTPSTSNEDVLVFRFRATTLSTARTADSYVAVTMVSAPVPSPAPLPVANGGGGGGGSTSFLDLLMLGALGICSLFLGRRETQGPHPDK